jgi:hypothetical protein
MHLPMKKIASLIKRDKQLQLWNCQFVKLSLLVSQRSFGEQKLPIFVGITNHLMHS